MLLTVAAAGGAVKSGVVSGSAFSKFTLLVMKTEDENAPTCTPYMPDDFVFDMSTEPCQAVGMKNEVAEEDQSLPSNDGCWSELKLSINNAIWMHAPGATTLAQAEKTACLAISYLAECAANRSVAP